MSRYEHRGDHADHSDTARRATSSIAPGKRTLAQSLPPVQRSLIDQRRSVVNFDDAAGDGIADTRATIERPTAHGPQLTERQIDRAKRKNPRWVERQGVAPSVFSTEPVDSAAFAHDVAEKQAAAGDAVDGIAGPKTVAAVTGSDPRRPRAAGRPAAVTGAIASFDPIDDVSDTRSTIDADPFAGEDPFAMHQIGT
jgi:hypothetical protein